MHGRIVGERSEGVVVGQMPSFGVIRGIVEGGGRGDIGKVLLTCEKQDTRYIGQVRRG